MHGGPQIEKRHSKEGFRPICAESRILGHTNHETRGHGRRLQRCQGLNIILTVHFCLMCHHLPLRASALHLCLFYQDELVGLAKGYPTHRVLTLTGSPERRLCWVVAGVKKIMNSQLFAPRTRIVVSSPQALPRFCDRNLDEHLKYASNLALSFAGPPVLVSMVCRDAHRDSADLAGGLTPYTGFAVGVQS